MLLSNVFLTALAATTLASPFVPLHRRAPNLSVELSAGIGSTEVKAVMTNNGAESLSILRSTSLMDPRPVKKLRIFRNATEVPFTGIHPRIPNTGFSKDAFTTLKPNASFETAIDIADVHDIAEGGTYKVMCAGRIRYAATNSTSVNTTELAGSITYQSNSLDVSINSVAVAKRANRTPALEKRTKIQSDCTGDQDAALKQALTNVEILAFRTAGEALNGPSAKFNEYFKTTQRSVRRLVADRLFAISNEASSIDSGVSTHFCTDQYGHCDGSTYAYTFPDNNTVVNCPLYYTLPSLTSTCHGLDQTTTTLHEFTHADGVFSPATDDHAYGYDECMQLTPAEALDNADTFALYANAIYARC